MKPLKTDIRREVANPAPPGQVGKPADDAVLLGDLSTSLGFLLRLAQVQVFQAFYETFSDRALKPGEFTVLGVIGLNPGLRQGVIARALKIKPAHMTKLVQRMVSAGLVDRRVPPGDRRSVKLSLTAAGDTYVKAHEAELLEFHRRERDGLSDSEFDQFSALLQKFIASGQADCPDP